MTTFKRFFKRFSLNISLTSVSEAGRKRCSDTCMLELFQNNAKLKVKWLLMKSVMAEQ